MYNGITMKRKELGMYIVADPDICHGTPTFKGTRIMVWVILEELAEGKSWDDIVANWRGDVTKEGIAEAVRLAGKAFEDHATEYSIEAVPA